LHRVVRENLLTLLAAAEQGFAGAPLPDFVRGDDKPVFHALPRISDVAVADLLSVIRARLLRYLVRRRVVEGDAGGEPRFLADDFGEREPALAQLAAAAVSGLPPAGPEVRRKPLTVVLPAATGPKVVRP